MNNLYNLSPIDSRYQDITKDLEEYLSEYALIKYRVFTEIKWLIFLIDKKVINFPSKKEIKKIEEIYEKFTIDEAVKVKEIEKTTKHDVKAIEYYLRDKFKELKIDKLNSYIHFLLTSEDINNVSYNLMIKESLNKVYFNNIDSLIAKLDELSNEYKMTIMLGHTHGQVATPTSVGKEFKVFSYRLKSVYDLLKKIKLKSKFSGTVGNYNAHMLAYPNVDWISLTKEFIESLNLDYNPLTTQIESHDTLCIMLSYLKVLNNIIKDLNSDMWLYISRNYFSEKAIKKEVGSSVMPHKVNPINHENSMANIELSNGLIDALVNNLSISRMQRDLSDSSKLRNIGVIIGHSLVSINQTLIGLNKIIVNRDVLDNELEDNYVVLCEAIQTILRKNNIENAYEQLKDLSRGQKITKDILQDYIKNLNINQNDKKILLSLTPKTYIGLVRELVENN